MTAILAGPFLRHVSNDQVNIFLALDAMPADAKAVVYDASDSVAGESGDWRKAIYQVAPNLYALILRAFPASGEFPCGHYQYNISVDGTDLAARGLLDGELPLGYAPARRPGFYLPEYHRRTVTASCRKPHASVGGNPAPDQLLQVDRMLAGSLDSAERPSRLVLTGDQIYADDVAPPLLALCERNAERIMGKREHVIESWRKGPLKPSDRKLDERHHFLRAKQGFTSDQKASHLVTYGEYLAMYLLVWGGNVERDIPGFGQVRHRLHNGEKPVSTAEYNWNRDSGLVEQFLTGARQVARLMANIPTYMIFDDHDVTDDWNLTEQHFRQMTGGSVLSRNVLVNALSAYTVFQHWGNCPDQFGVEVMENIQQVYGQLGFDLWHKLEPYFTRPERLYFGYAVLTTPPILVLDTRTHRSFPGNGLALMDERAFAQMECQLATVDRGNNALVLVSPTPVFGFNLVERLQLRTGGDLACKFDKEPWIANEDVLGTLRDIIGRHHFTEIYTLSGDVHYSFAREESGVQVNGRRQNWWQLTSSPSCNVPVGGKWFYCLSDRLERGDCWDREETHYLPVAEDSELVIQGYCNIGLLELDPGSGAAFKVLRNVEGQQETLTYSLVASAQEVREDELETAEISH